MPFSGSVIRTAASNVRDSLEGTLLLMQSGHVEFGGWTNKGIMQFNELVQIVKTDHNGQHAPKLEQKLLQELKDSSDGNRASQLEIQ